MDLYYLLLNAKNNIKEWQKLVDAKRKKGWTPPKKLKNGDNKNKNKNDGNIKKKKETVFVDIKID